MNVGKKNKIINDPIYGFITLKDGVISKIIEHSFFQRLRRVSQLGLSSLVYPGALHTRFQHAIGCMYLMERSILEIRKKGHQITEEESESLKIAILLHDIGHGPFSHSLENIIVQTPHEKLSLLFMEKLNDDLNGQLELALLIFKNQYKKKFLHQLVSSQLDMDRLDYLKRDSFYSGVIEGNVGTDRIINMMNIVDDELVIEEKGIYSIEKFLIARRLMYWQVYLHKTVISFEHTLIQTLKRAKEKINKSNNSIFCTDQLKLFLENNFNEEDFRKDSSLLLRFSLLDDHDIYYCLKEWCKEKDIVISTLSRSIVNRDPLNIIIRNTRFTHEEISKKKKQVMNQYKVSKTEVNYLVFNDKVSNNTYKYGEDDINILMKDGGVKNITDASDQFNIHALSKTINKYFLCYR